MDRDYGSFVEHNPFMEDAPFKEDLNNVVICRDCQEFPPNLVEEFSSGDVVCGSCGLVVGDRIIDNRSEWRTFADSEGEDPSRVGEAANPLLDGSQLETSIAFGDSKAAKQLSRLQNQTTQDRGTKSLLAGFKQINDLSDRFALGNAIATGAKHLYRLLEDGKFIKGKSQEIVSATCVFIAARQSGAARTFKEVGAETGHDKKDLGRMFKLIENYLKKHGKSSAHGLLAIENYQGKGTTGADALVGRFCAQLGFRQAQKMENAARDLAIQAATVSELASRSPLSLAAACIYMASHLLGDPRPSRDIASIANVSDGTVKNAYKHLYSGRDNILNTEFMSRHKADAQKLPAN